MTSLRIAALAACALAASGCSTLRNDAPRGSELVDHQVRMENANGVVSTLSFDDDGSVTARFGNNSVTGRWQVRGEELCFWWGNAARECWPYPSRFERGRTRNLTSDRGNRVSVTLL